MREGERRNGQKNKKEEVREERNRQKKEIKGSGKRRK